MGFIDMSDADYLPIFYNVYHAVGTHRAGHAVTQSIERDDTDHAFSQSIGSDGSERYVNQSIGRDGGERFVNQSIGRDNRERSVIQSIGRGDANRAVTQSIGRDGGEKDINTTAAVWSTCPNQPDDVKLVQYLLKAFYDVQPPHVRPPGEMKIDGLCGPVTNRWILQFQRDCNLASGEQVLLMDNRVDKVLNKNPVGGISRKMCMLAMLNINVKYYSLEVWAKAPLFVPLHNPYGVQVSYKGVVTAGEAA